ncbi:MAG: 7-carboxy-7-deazaguanine synthase QueE [Crocinitomicaceae bacterium]|nr:7-carboxy-7-deazaguanine synthase QueE [Crocinitomicaceae bacterium]MBK9592954.1 7-carboxy-7-deazaguanine synthase QueE [Crocinitomicaceae bacterium]
MSDFNDQELPLMEEFYSLQGEGFYAGRPAYFIRLAGCDVGCHWCDVKESWDANKHSKVLVSELVQRVLKSGTGLVVITGGEPAMYDLTLLTESLRSAGTEIAIETSGAYSLKGHFDWVCLSPKKFKMPLEENYKKAHELKMIIFNKHDLVWAEELKQKINSSSKRYLQPEWDKRDEVLPIMLDYVKKNTEWTISLQTHKYLNIP